MTKVKDAIIVGYDGSACADTAADVAVEPLLSFGPPALVLVDSSKHADLIVVGSHGHSGFRELMLGSVSAHHASCPVAVVRS